MEILFSANPTVVIATLEEIDNRPINSVLTNELVGLLSWLHNRWAFDTNVSAYQARYHQATLLGWRQKKYEEIELHKQISTKICELLAVHFTAEIVQQILNAGSIFQLAYTNKVYVGNGDVGGYCDDCEKYWGYFAKQKHYFEALLGKYEIFDNEWITLAQVLWGNYRWTADDSYDGVFSPQASFYFLEKAVQLQPKIPIHYFTILTHRLKYNKDYSAVLQEDQMAVINHAQSLTYFYYAQCLQDELGDTEQALIFYQKFIEQEPQLLPCYDFELFNAEASERTYSPSTPEALTAVGRIFIQKGDNHTAKKYLQQAIDLQPQHPQAPYYELAKIYAQEGDKDLYTYFLEEQINVLSHKPSIFYRYQYDKSQKSRYLLGNSFFPYSRMKVYLLHDFIYELAQYYLYEAVDYVAAQHYHKRLLRLLQDQQYVYKLQHIVYHYEKILFKPQSIITELLENQIRMAYDLQDYWQVRSLCEKLQKYQNSSVVAKSYLIKVREILGY